MTEYDRRSFMKQAGATVTALSILPEFTSAAPRRDGDPLRIGVIGTGRQGRMILRELQKFESAKTVAYCDIDDRRLRSAARSAPPEAKAYEDYGALLDDANVQAVIIATPTHVHREPSIAALQAGKHVYCEAPLASTIEDCTAIADAARNAGARFQTGLQARSNPIYKLARTFYRSDALLDLVAMRAQHDEKQTWRSPARDPQREKLLNWRLDPDVSIGLPGEFGTHQFDVINWYLGKYPTEVRGTGDVLYHRDGRTIPDTIQCNLAYPNNVHLQYQATLANSFEGTYEVFYGSNSAIKLAWTAGWMFKEADAPTQGWEVYANRQQFHNDEGITLIADATKLAAQGRLQEGVGLPNPPVYYSLTDFINSVTQDEPVVCSAGEGLRATVAGICAHQAVATRTRVAISEDILKGS
jgi:predicted dehydrogenase